MMSGTSLALSNLRGLAILLVLAFHSFIAYLGSNPSQLRSFDSAPYEWTGMPVVDSARWFGLDLFCALQWLYLMQLMFFLSGVFVWPSLLRKGPRKFLQDRCMRLGVPFVLGVFVLMPLAYYPAYRLRAVDPGWWAFWSHWRALPFWPCGPLWFLWFLLALNFAAAAFSSLSNRATNWLAHLATGTARYPGALFVALIGLSALSYVPLAAIFEPWDWTAWGPFAFQPSFAPQYVIFFVAGLAVGAKGLEQGLLRIDGMLSRRWPVWLACVPAGFLLWSLPTALIMTEGAAAPPLVRLVADLGFVFAAAASCFAIVALFLRFGAVRQPVLDQLSENAYGIYVVHYGFVVWLQYVLLGLGLLAVVKGIVVLAAAAFLSWALAAAIARLPFAARLIRVERSRVMGRTPALARDARLTPRPGAEPPPS